MYKSWEVALALLVLLLLQGLGNMKQVITRTVALTKLEECAVSRRRYND